MELVFGNAHDADTEGTGWFVGYGDWTRSGPMQLLHVPGSQRLSGFCIKWYDHPTGHGSGDSKPISEGRTISILVTENSAFQIEFSESAGFEPDSIETVVLRRHGDFVAWGAGLFHRWQCLASATILTVRWNPD